MSFDLARRSSQTRTGPVAGDAPRDANTQVNPDLSNREINRPFETPKGTMSPRGRKPQVL